MEKRETHYNYLKSPHVFLNSCRKNAPLSSYYYVEEALRAKPMP